ncbi:MAG: hypothetical protein E7456_05160 [Ruminococcaceae bacterium]|nr:hypothetical protein [Oscillospiraceae bacterium]
MRYVVMECYTSYAIVLSEDGRFLNVANMNYQVGQTLNDVFAMDISHAYPKRGRKVKLFAVIVFVICLIGLAVGVFKYLSQPYASVYMTINPSVRIDVKRDNTVDSVEGINYDGVWLVEDYVYEDKHLELVVNELIELAMDLGYLNEGDEVRITFDTDDDEWESHMEQVIRNEIDDNFDIEINSDDNDDDDDDDEEFDD